jgi:RNA polymerase-binding transcription factor
MTLDTGHFRRKLEDERARVAAALDHLRSGNAGSMEDEVDESHFDNHLAETASVTIAREIDYSLEENEARVLTAIDAALGRIDDGTYGRCERCGREIEAERLEALPWATLCIDDKRRDERG